MDRPLIGRYAPSPSGDLHFGSLVAAVASYCNVKAAGGRWLLRIDDLDAPRVVPGASARIIKQLTAFGLVPDGPVLYQSTRGAAYAAAIDTLLESGDAFVCGCTRREAQSGPEGLEGPIYPGTCRSGLPDWREPRSIRLRVRDEPITLDDPIQGAITQNLARDVGDFVIRRADGITAYQLATVVDDGYQAVTEVVRGADLLSSAPRQRDLQQRLGMSPTTYLHVPAVVDHNGEKLGKSTGALALDCDNASALLAECLALLGQPVANISSDASVRLLLGHALSNWSTERIPKRSTICRRR